MSPSELRGSSQPHPPRAVLREAAAAQLWGLSGREEPSGDASGHQAGGGLSCILGSGPPSHLWGQQAGPGRAAVYLCSSLPSPTALGSATVTRTPGTVPLSLFPHLLSTLFLASTPPSLCLCLSDSRCLCLGPRIFVSGPGSPAPVRPWCGAM